MPKIEIVLPVDNHQTGDIRVRASLSKLKTLLTKGITLTFKSYTNESLITKISIYDEGHERWPSLHRVSSRRLSDTAFFSFEFELPWEEDPIKKWPELAHVPEDRRNHYWNNINAEHVAEQVRNFCISMNISHPGTIQYSEPIIFVEGKIQTLAATALFSWISTYMETTSDLGLNPLRELDPISAWNWFSSQPGIASGFSKSPVSRACSIFTHLFHDSLIIDEMADFIWTISGIEALLSDGRGSYAAQIIGKLAALGIIDPPSIRIIGEQFKKIYVLRSKCVHGDREIRNKFIDDVKTETDRRHYDEMRNATAVCCYVLIFLLQFSALNQLSEISFQFAYVGGLPKNP